MADTLAELRTKVDGLITREGKTNITDLVLQSVVKDTTTQDNIPVTVPTINQTAPIDKITGFSLGSTDSVIYFNNLTGASIEIKHEDEASLPDNRINTPTGENFILLTGQTARFARDPVARKWLMAVFPVASDVFDPIGSAAAAQAFAIQRANHTGTQAAATVSDFAAAALAALTVDYPEANLGTLTFNGTPPSGSIVKQYRGYAVGKLVTVFFRITATVAGASNSVLTFDLPAALPAPAIYASQPNSEIIVPGTGSFGAAGVDTYTAMHLQKSSGGTVEVHFERTTGVNIDEVQGQITYLS